MPLILGTNSIKDTGYNVANSCRFDSGSTDHLDRTFGSAGNRKTFTVSFWLKTTTEETYNAIFDSGADGSNSDDIYFHTGRLNFSGYYGSTQFMLRTKAKYRDPSAWTHFVVAFDTTQSTASNRLKMYANGVQETAFDDETYPSQDFQTTYMNTARLHNIGTLVDSDNFPLDGYLAEFVFIDGQALDPTSFGEFDSDSPNIWKPIDVTGLTFGTNGFYLDFENSSSLGADQSGNSNDFTARNLTSVDQSTDTCTNNFATANPLIANSNVEYSDGNLNTYHTYAGQWRSTISTIGASSGKWYAEYKISAVGTEVSVGNCDVTTITQTSANDFIGEFTDSVGYVNSGSIYKANSVAQGSLTTYTANDIIGIAMDLDNNTIQFYKNGSAIGTTTSLTADKTYAFGAAGYGDARILWNIGSPSFSISSGNSDANGYGNFEYSPTIGGVNYYALNTKNLAEFG